MSLNKPVATNESSTSSPSAKRATPNKPRTLSRRGTSLPQHSMVESESSGGSSLDELYSDERFARGWHNEVSFHVAENAIHLRKYRKMTQAEVAKLMETSQSAIARIEGGDDNITASTLKRLVTTLRGRLCLSFPPEELVQRPLRPWWESSPPTATSTSAWTPVAGLMSLDETLALIKFQRTKLLGTGTAS